MTHGRFIVGMVALGAMAAACTTTAASGPTPLERGDAGVEEDARAADDEAPADPVATWSASMSVTGWHDYGPTYVSGGITYACYGVRYEDATLTMKITASGKIASVDFSGMSTEGSKPACNVDNREKAKHSFSFSTKKPDANVVTVVPSPSNTPAASLEAEVTITDPSTALAILHFERTDAESPYDWKYREAIILTKAEAK